MKKYIFSDKTEEAFVVFEGCNKCFWVSNDNVRYCHTNLNYKKAILFHKQGILTSYKQFESSENEYNDFVKKADSSEKELVNEWLKYFNLA